MRVDQPPPLASETISLHDLPNWYQSTAALDLEQHCHGFLDLIVDYLSLSAGWVLQQDSGQQMPTEIARYCTNSLSCGEDDIQQLFLEQAGRLDQPGLQGWTCLGLNAYSCRLNWQQKQYVLFIAEQRLSSQQRQWVEHQILLLTDYLAVHQTFSQQRADLLAMQQHLHRTEHQLGTPLSLITLYADMLKVKSPEGLLQDYLVPLQKAVKQLHGYVRELVDGDSESVLNAERCYLRDLVAGNVQVLQSWLQKRQIEIYYPQDSVQVWVDRWQMLQVFDNLLSNALHFSPDGGQILLTWQLFQAEILIEVRDQGPGLSPEDLSCVFSPYYSRRPGGRGLGLAIAQQIVGAHRGRLWASNLPEGGAQFSISLPREPNV